MQSKVESRRILKLAVQAAGGQSVVERKLKDLGIKISQQAVSMWIVRGICPANRVLLLESIQDKVTRYELRPDLYPKNEKAHS